VLVWLKNSPVLYSKESASGSYPKLVESSS